jgi:Leucine-rich repeat (LRR) protein
LTLSTSICETDLPLSQYNALYALYNATNGPSWCNNGTKWIFESYALFPNAPCLDGWDGVECECRGIINNSTAMYSIRSLTLASFCMHGTIPNAISDLSNLRSLQFDQNDIFGSLPSNIGNLEYLENLDGSSNLLTGTLPSSLYTLGKLYNLSLSNNILKGTISNDIKYLTSVRILELSMNHLQGSLPPDIGSLSSLVMLNINSNYINGTIPASVYDLMDLKYLYLYDNLITGTLSSSICQLTSLLHLDLFLNRLIGSIPQNIGNLTLLEHLFLYENAFTGSIPSSLYNLTSLTQLDIHINYIAGSIPSDVSKLTNLITFNLYSNQLTGTIPPEIGLLTQLLYLTVSENDLHGTIPEAIYDLSLLYTLDLSICNFDGTISPSIGNLIHVVYLYLYENPLSGSLPSTIGRLTAVEHFDVFETYVSGSIPAEIGNLISATYLYLYSNRLSGTIPMEVGQLSSLIEFDVATNKIHGTIPETFANISSLQILYLLSNQLTGSIPSSLCNLTNLVQLDLYNNHLTGTIPREIGNLINILILRLDTNKLSGSIPSSIGQLTAMLTLYLDGNELNGSLPNTLYELGQLQNIFLQHNNLLGTLSSNISKLSSLQRINFAMNFLTGKMPTELADINGLVILYLEFNYLTGSYPSYLLEDTSQFLILDIGSNYLTGSITPIFSSSLQYYYIYTNYFTSTIPSELFGLSGMQAIWLYENSFTGILPYQVAQQPSLSQLIIHNNQLSGKFFEYFNLSSTNSFLLETVDISTNLFSGSISNEFFTRLRYLTAISGVLNCFVGSIPRSVCNHDNYLSVIDFDGMGSNEACDENKLIEEHLPSFVNGRFAVLGLDGSIPHCILELPYLTNLHLSGNNLQGSIPSLSNQSLLVDLTLSNNALTGTIPISIQRHEFQQLDLSNNRLRGTLIDEFAVSADQTVLGLAVNRLSGKLPSSLTRQSTENVKNLTSLNILASNVFSCQIDEIPSKDSYAGVYSCGSYEQDVAVYTWLAFAGLTIILIAIGYLFLKQQQYSFRWINIIVEEVRSKLALLSSWFAAVQALISANSSSSSSIQLKETKSFLIFMNVMISWTIVIFAIIIFMMIPIYLGFQVTSSIVSDQYGYVLSIAFYHGIAPVICLGCLILLLSSLMILVITTMLSLYRRSMGDVESPSKQHSSYRFILSKYSLIVVLHSINLAITIAVNTAYVNAILTNSHITRLSLFVIQICLGTFKLTWNALYIPWCSRRFSHFMSQPRSMVNRLVMSITNFIIAPCLATLVVNQSCFYYVFVVNSQITSSVFINLCSLAVPCINQSAQTISFNSTYIPPFQYSFACGTSLLVAYVPVLIYTYVANGFIVPIFRIIVALYPELSRIATIPFTFLSTQKQRKSYLTRIRGRDLTIIMLLHATVLLTFGLASSILGIIVVVTIVNEYLTIKLFIGRCLSTSLASSANPSETINPLAKVETSSEASQRGGISDDLLRMEFRDMKDSWRGLFASYSLIFLTVFIFWGLLFFDMIADVYTVMAAVITSSSFIAYGIILIAMSLSMKKLGWHLLSLSEYLTETIYHAFGFKLLEGQFSSMDIALSALSENEVIEDEALAGVVAAHNSSFLEMRSLSQAI